MAGLVVAVGVFLLVQTASLNVPANANVLGPKFFPTMVGALLVGIGAAFALQSLRELDEEPLFPPADQHEPGPVPLGEQAVPRSGVEVSEP